MSAPTVVCDCGGYWLAWCGPRCGYGRTPAEAIVAAALTRARAL